MRKSSELWYEFMQAMSKTLKPSEMYDIDLVGGDFARDAESAFIAYIEAKAEEEDNANPQSHTD